MHAIAELFAQFNRIRLGLIVRVVVYRRMRPEDRDSSIRRTTR